MKKLALLLFTISLSACAVLGPSVRQPNSDVPFDYQIGWWASQNGLSISSLEVNVIDSRLGLLNSKSLVSITISGSIKGSNIGFRPFIEYAHISEQVNANTSVVDHQGTITITPIVGLKTDNSYNLESVPFTIKQELVLKSMGWGKNSYNFICQQTEKNIELWQRK